MTLVVPTLRTTIRTNPPRQAKRLPAPSGVMAWHVCAVIVTCVLVLASSVDAVTPAKLIGPDLNAQSVEIASLGEGTINYFDEDRTLQSSSVDGFVQLRSIGGDDVMQATGLPSVLLTDGQRFVGEWVGPTKDGTAMRWRHVLFGTITVALEDIASVNWIPSDRQQARNGVKSSDELTLINGDMLLGFVSSLSERGVVLVPDQTGGGAAPVTIPFSRIASMVLSNPSSDVAGAFHRLTLADGSRVWADQLQISGGVVSCRVFPGSSSSVPVQTPVTDLTRIDFWAGGLRLIDLTDLPRRTAKEAGVFGLPIPVRVTMESIRMHAPDSIVFDLPDGTQRFAAIAELDTLDAPVHMAKWSDFQVLVSSEDSQAQRYRVSGAEPTAMINTPASGPSLMIRLDPGVNGPILDRLLLHDAVILVRTPVTGPVDDPAR